MKQREQLGAILWIFCFQFLLVEQLVSHAWRIPYSFARNYISDLGAEHCNALICSPWHAMMNGSFVLQGMLIGVGAMLLWERSRHLERFALVLLLLCGAGVVIVGFAPEDGNAQLHFMGAAVHFVAGGLGICLMGISALGKSADRAKGLSFVAMGLAVLIATILLSERALWDASMMAFQGAIERVASYSITLWMMLSGLLALRESAERSRLQSIYQRAESDPKR